MVMAAFRNQGWEYYDMMSEIMPNASARGIHSFSPMNTVPPGQLRDDEAAAETTTTSGHIHIADVDKDGDCSTLISTAASKLQKIPSTTVDNDDSITFNSGFPTFSASDATSNPMSIPTSDLGSNLSSNPTSDLGRSAKGSRKTRSTPAESQSGKLLHDSGPSRRAAGPSRQSRESRRTKAATSRRSSKNATLNNTGEASSSIIVHNMQGAINMLTATVRDSVSIDPITKVRQDAVRLLQKEEGLSSEEQIALFQMFSDKHALAQTYLVIEAAQLRLGWLRELLKGVEGGNPNV